MPIANHQMGECFRFALAFMFRHNGPLAIVSPLAGFDKGIKLYVFFQLEMRRIALEIAS